MSIDCADIARRRLVLSLARQASIQAPQKVLEEAVSTNNFELIESMQQILAKALKVNTNENDASLTHVNDATLKLPPGWSGPAEGCKPDACDTCFYQRICSGEAFNHLISKSREILQAAKDSIAEENARNIRRNRNQPSKVAF